MALAASVRQVNLWLVPEVTLLSTHERWRKQAEILRLSKEARIRLEWFIWHKEHGKNASKTARHFGISRQCFHTWKKRFDAVNLRSLETHDRAPRRVRQKEITPEEEGRVIMLRHAHIRWGKMKIAKVYEATYRKKISAWKVQYTIKKNALYYHPKKNAQTHAKRKRSKEKKRITTLHKKPFPGFLIALDTIVLWIGNQRRYVFTAIDTVSKIAFARMYTTKSSKNAADFVKRMVYLLDHEVWNAGHDNGSEFHKHFQATVTQLGLGDYWSRVKTPTDNPINERFNRTLQEEFIALGHLTDDTERFNHELTNWLIEYTFVRPHQSLGYETPWQYYSKAAKVSPMYSSRTSPCFLREDSAYSLAFLYICLQQRRKKQRSLRALRKAMQEHIVCASKCARMNMGFSIRR
ncbi:transposase [Candidatus Kaiserbacteria bacterium]|nr:transposase [Candidatus Kaiserbacteria bacterium]